MDRGGRKRRGAWYTPQHLVDSVVAALVDAEVVAAIGDRAVTVLDPACGDGRFLRAARERIESMGGRCAPFGVDVDAAAIDSAHAGLADATLVVGDALAEGVVAAITPESGFDLVVGNPPYLSQLAATTARGAASRLGGGPYADAAVEFVALAANVVRRNGGRVGFVLPQSVLAARDAEAVRRRVDERSRLIWSAWSGTQEFDDAEVLTCALVFEFGRATTAAPGSWAHVVTDRLGIPALPEALVVATSTLGDRATLNANFRDEYYGMIPAVGDHAVGPPLVTSGLIDPGRSLWGVRPVRFAKRDHLAPRIDLAALDAPMQRWARKRLVPKVLVANQTPIVEAVCDPDGEWLPGVPVVAVYPHPPRAAASSSTGPAGRGRPGESERAWEIAAVLTSASASAWSWHRRGGTGLSANTIRLGPAMLAELPWPPGDVAHAVDALRRGDVVGCGRLVDEAHGIPPDERDRLDAWWRPIVERLLSRTPAAVIDP